ncbi:MAG: hypothetical protein FWG09_05605 [Synergistaceae bacterium]|nr:hypothetical protein [Synergistaceae bacterium]
MKKIIISLALIFIINSAAAAAPSFYEFPLGMAKTEAVAKGLVLQDQFGGLMDVDFGGKTWPTALVFEDEKLVYLILKGNGNEYLSASDDGLGRLGWLVIYASTDKNLVFDAIKLASSGKDEEGIADEFEKFQEIMQSQNFTNFTSIYISDWIWMALKHLRGENPAEKYPDATICNMTANGNEITLMFSTFGYMEKAKKQRKQ